MLACRVAIDTNKRRFSLYYARANFEQLRKPALFTLRHVKAGECVFTFWWRIYLSQWQFIGWTANLLCLYSPLAPAYGRLKSMMIGNSEAVRVSITLCQDFHSSDHAT